VKVVKKSGYLIKIKEYATLFQEGTALHCFKRCSNYSAKTLVFPINKPIA
jgi:hypothetical protein